MLRAAETFWDFIDCKGLAVLPVLRERRDARKKGVSVLRAADILTDDWTNDTQDQDGSIYDEKGKESG